MQIKQGNRKSALRGVDAFIDEHAAILPSVANAGVRTRLKGQIAELDQSGESQEGHANLANGLVRKQTVLRKTLMAEQMLPISRVAAADLPKTPELSALRMPRQYRTNEQLILAAEGMAAAALPHSDVFIAAGLPSDFLDRLRGAALDLRRAIDLRTASRGKRSGATKGIASQLVAAARTVRVLDALVRKDLQSNADLLVEWEVVKTPLTKAGRPASPESTPTPVTPPATTPTTTPSPVSTAA